MIFLQSFSGTGRNNGNVRQSVMTALTLSDWQRLYRLSEAQEFGLNFTTFCNALIAVAEKYLPGDTSASQQREFYEDIHLKDFALAQACSHGCAGAWEDFLQRFRTRLYAAALVLTREEEAAHDLADSIAGDLFITKKLSFEGPWSKLATYTGRGSLEGWLKALLTRTYIDRYRHQQRSVSLEQRIDLLATLCVHQDVIQHKADPRLPSAVEQAFHQCNAQERFLLTAYYFDRWTLKEVAVTLGVHESSASRQMERLLRKLRRDILQRLQEAGMSYAQAKELFQIENWDLSIDLRGILLRGLTRE